jgi:hypothetical protein
VLDFEISRLREEIQLTRPPPGTYISRYVFTGRSTDSSVQN